MNITRPPGFMGIFLCLFLFPSRIYGEKSIMYQLSVAPDHIETFKELAVVYDATLPKVFNNLKPEERIFIYYMLRASLPGNRICTDQMHKDGIALQEIFQALLGAEKELVEKFKKKDTGVSGLNIPKFIQEVKTYAVYLWSNHGQYFAREHADEKRTPNRLGLKTLTKENVCRALHALGQPTLASQVEELERVIFDHSYQSTGTVPGSIEQSARNFYAPGFTEQDYLSVPMPQRSALNAYFELTKDATGNHVTTLPYTLHGKYGKELTVAVHWLKKACEHAKRYPATFDAHLVKGLDYLTAYLQSGDEELFKKHSIEWLQAKNRVDYCFGFIETYDDPKNQRGTFQADATIRTISLDNLSAILPSIEAQLPVDDSFKRNLTGEDVRIPNASINTKVFGTGGLGPLHLTAAYCLPNYEEIRAIHGSKQIIYPAGKSLGMLINPNLSTRIFFGTKEAAFLEANDPDHSFLNDLWDVHCILHETLGHGSGKLAMHTCTNQELRSLQDTNHQPGDQIPVTSENLAELLCGYDATIEELRAEIIALYVSIYHLEQLVEQGLLRSWYHKLGKKELQRWLMFHMLDTGLMRMLQQPDSATSISGDHARANTTIMHYIIDAGGARIVQNAIEYDGKQYQVVALEVIDMEKALAATTKLLKDVQRIKSTGDGTAAKQLIDTYGTPIRNLAHFKQLKENNRILVGDLKGKVAIYPNLEPVYDDTRRIIDIKASWPTSIFDQWQAFTTLALSMEE